jgi:hypothetical protein
MVTNAALRSSVMTMLAVAQISKSSRVRRAPGRAILRAIREAQGLDENKAFKEKRTPQFKGR